jgi:DnaK suppressor protein
VRPPRGIGTSIAFGVVPSNRKGEIQMHLVNTNTTSAVPVSRVRTIESLRATLADLEKSVPSREELALTQAPDLLDAIQLAADRELAIERIDRNTRSRSSIHEALEQIEQGRYGICMDCDEPIAQKRLAAIPWAIRCVSCQSKADDGESNSTAFNWPNAA